MTTTTIPELDARGLRRFGLTTGAIFVMLFGIVLPLVLKHTLPAWPWILFAVLATWSLVAPGSLNPVYKGWMRFGMLLGKVTTPIIMTLVFVVAFLPTAIMLKLLKKDFMQRKFDDSTTYRVNSRNPSVENMEKPY